MIRFRLDGFQIANDEALQFLEPGLCTGFYRGVRHEVNIR